MRIVLLGMAMLMAIPSLALADDNDAPNCAPGWVTNTCGDTLAAPSQIGCAVLSRRAMAGNGATRHAPTVLSRKGFVLGSHSWCPESGGLPPDPQSDLLSRARLGSAAILALVPGLSSPSEPGVKHAAQVAQGCLC